MKLDLSGAAGASCAFSPAEIRRRFRCHSCGACCRGEGHVWLEEADERRLAAFFGLDRPAFRERYTRLDDAGQRVLLDQSDLERSCIFLENGRCVAHEAKPRQCREFPFTWRSPDIAETCEGWRRMLGLPVPPPGK